MATSSSTVTLLLTIHNAFDQEKKTRRLSYNYRRRVNCILRAYIYIYLFVTQSTIRISYSRRISPPPLRTPLTRHASFAVCENEALVVVHAGRPRAPKPRVTSDNVA